MVHEVLIPPKVATEIEAIGDWIAKDNPAAARRMIERLYRRCLSLDHFPERGRPYGATYRAVNEGRYVIIYRVEPDARRRSRRHRRGHARITRHPPHSRHRQGVSERGTVTAAP